MCCTVVMLSGGCSSNFRETSACRGSWKKSPSVLTAFESSFQPDVAGNTVVSIAKMAGVMLPHAVGPAGCSGEREAPAGPMCN